MFTLEVSVLLQIQVAMGRAMSTMGSSIKCHRQDSPLKIAFSGTRGGDYIRYNIVHQFPTVSPASCSIVPCTVHSCVLPSSFSCLAPGVGGQLRDLYPAPRVVGNFCTCNSSGLQSTFCLSLFQSDVMVNIFSY